MTLDHLHSRLLDADIQYLIRAKAGQLATADGGSSPLADLVGPEERSNRVGRFVAPEDEARELALDVRAVLDGLPARVRKLAGRLATQSRAEIVRSTGQSETRVREAFLRLREAFERAGLDSYLPGARK